MSLNLKDNLILLSLSGSRAYGTHTPDSDVDLKGIIIPDKKHLFGFQNFESSSDVEFCGEYISQNLYDVKREGVIYSLKKFLQLCINSNPNIMDVIWASRSCILFSNEYGDEIIKNKELFLSANKIKSSWFGASNSYIKKTKDYSKWLNTAPKNGDSDWSDFCKWKSDTNVFKIESKYGYNTKAVSHAIRLLHMHKEILLDGTLNIDRSDIDASFLKDIRAGKFTYDEMISMVKDLNNEIENIYLKKSYVIKEEPDYNAAESLLINLTTRHIAGEIK